MRNNIRLFFIVILAISTIQLLGCTNSPVRDANNLSNEEQFDTVMNKYPAVANYIIGADLMLEIVTTGKLLISHGELYQDPELAQRIQDMIHYSSCPKIGGVCYHPICVFSRDDSCERGCRLNPNQYQAEVCLTMCRNSQLSCSFERED